MKIVETSVKRPVGVIMIVLAILALGAMSLRNLTIDLFPEIDLPIAVVATSYPDAAPQEVEKQISQPIESAVSSIEGVQTIQAQSQSGSSLVIMMFDTGVNLDNALLEVRESVDQVKGMLPDSAGDPSVLRFNPQQIPVMWVGLTGDNLEQLQGLAGDRIVPHLERQGGVASVSVEGGRERVIELELDQAKMAQYGLQSQIIMQALQGANTSGSAGVVTKGDKELQIRIDGSFSSVDDIAQTIVQTPQGATIHVEDVAEVKETYNQTGITRVNGEPAVVLPIMKKTDGNTVEVSNHIKTAVDELKEDLPEGVNLEVVLDTSTFITSSMKSVVQNMIIGGFFALLILLLFLKSVRATLVVGLSIPIAIISTFVLLYFTGETLNVLTMGGLALGIGMMVDSSIVILENIISYRQKGYSVMESAKKGASELAPAVIASTTTTLVVFLPIVFVEGIASELFTPLALTVTFSLVASLVVAVTLVPMLSSKLLTKAMKDNGRRYWFDRFLTAFNNRYEAALKKVLVFRKTTILVTVLAIAGSLALIPLIGTAFIPEGDQGQISISVRTAEGTTQEETLKVSEQVNEKLKQYEDIIETNYVTVASSGSMSGGMGQGSTNEASYTLQLVPQSDRDQTTDQVVADLDKDLQTIAGAEMTINASGGGMSGGTPIQIQVSGPEHEVLRELADQVVLAISDIDGIHNPQSSISETRPELEIEVDREKAAQFGLSYQDVMSQTQLAMTGQTVMSYREGGEDRNVNMIFPEESRSTISDVENLKIQTANGNFIPLASVASFEQVQSPAELTRENQQPQVNVSSEILNRDLGSVSEDVKQTLEQMDFPEEYSYSIGGEAQDMAEAFSDLAIALVVSIFLVYAVMAVQFENFLTPFVIMFSMPATVVGVLAGLFITGKPLSITAFIGVIMLAGIVVNNAIVLVDYINILRSRGMDRKEAILEAGVSRMRPILMTTLTTILGMLPLALGYGEGAETQQPLAITVIFGLTISSIFTLFLIPVVYTYFDGLSERVKGLFGRRKKVVQE
ncbi:efflux RND transporter permease subunit [Radiobacillus kanasensis]|uniref:efflux RND transporter permease subunit n=1 Tax=Radiobacillus kanasensis TaxID=2844358 RepID=UPI001E373C67|nr:efflux RND transporter permease subunit [Radiobacillus kanasensis]UFT98896.1 efflux RND transporter permease subunit [Radiobacillus kanasensis]